MPLPSNNVINPITLLQSMLTIPSLSRMESPLARYLVEQAQQMGLYAHIDEVGNFIASTQNDEDVQDPIILLGHMDTVPGNIPVRIEDGLLYGRGAVDAKGPLAAFLAATARIAQTGDVQRPIIVIGAVEEEAATSRGAHAVVHRYAPSACIIGEPSGSQAVTIGYKGRLLVDCCVSRSSSHSAGPRHNSSEVAAAFWERVRVHAAEWNAQNAPNSSFAALLPSLRSISSSQDGLEEQTRMLLGYRLPPAYNTASLQMQLEQWANEDGVQLQFSGEETAFQSTRTTPLARAFLSAIRSTGGQPTFKHKTGTSDMNVVGPVWGQNILAYGPGDSSLDHTPNEHISLAEYNHAIDVLHIVLRDLSQQREVAQ
jgi:N-acetyl-ornithine/N-acetyl-lysine deacetylase